MRNQRGGKKKTSFDFSLDVPRESAKALGVVCLGPHGPEMKEPVGRRRTQSPPV